MEANKENINRTNLKTRIPLPTGPLPALPKYLLQKRIENNTIDEVRLPLRTINTSPLAGTSRASENIKKRHSIKVDTRHVTLRNNNEELDWDHKVFKDDSVIIISDDESFDENDKKHYAYFTEQDQKNSLGEAKRAITPVPKPSPLEPNRVRNIKRSLKRPHSRELQGISPVVKPENRGEEKFKRRLNFNESYECKLPEVDFAEKSYTKRYEKDYVIDMFSYLLTIERRGLLPAIPRVTRACLLNWLMRVNGPNSPEVVQTACWYLDSILHISSVSLENLQPVAAACYWIALKLHGPVPKASGLVKCSKRAFTAKRLMDAEMEILKILKFPPKPIIPQEYITYLSACVDNAKLGDVEVAATFLCMSGLIVDKSLCTELPSVIAAACVRNATLLLRKKDSMVLLQMSPIYQAAEKKATNICTVCSALRRAVRIVASPTNEYKAPLENYGQGPEFIAQKVVAYANELALIDAKTLQ